MNPLEVFTYRQYSDATLSDLYDDLTKNPDSFKTGTDENIQFCRVIKEMHRRGLPTKYYNKRKKS